MSLPETEKQRPSSYVDKLKTLRHEQTSSQAFDQLKKDLTEFTAINISLGILFGKREEWLNASWSDEPNPAIGTVIALESLAMRGEFFVSLSSEESTHFGLLENEWIEAKKYRGGFTTIRSDTSLTEAEVRRHLEETATFRSIQELLTQFDGINTELMSDIEIDGSKEGLLLFAFLKNFRIEPISLRKATELFTSDIDSEALNQEIIDQVFQNTDKYTVAEENTDGITHFIFPSRSDPSHELIIRKTPEGKYKIGCKIDPSKAYMERPDQEFDSHVLPFIETQVAKELLTSFEAVGIRFSEDIEKSIIHDRESDRYGNVMTHISREIAKMINDLNRGFNNLFQDQEGLVRKLDSLDETKLTDKTALIVVRMLKGILYRKESQDDLPVTNEYVQMNKGSCFDVAGYFERASTEGGLHLENINNKRMLYKTHGAHTYMNLDAVIFNGVEIPPGGLFIKAEDGNFAFLRLTPYMDIEDAENGPFAPEVAKAMQQRSDGGGLTDLFNQF